MKSVSRLVSAVLAFPVLLVACHGGSSSTFLPGSGAGTASFTIAVPAPAPGRQPQIQSASITLTGVNGSAAPASMTPMTLNLNKNVPGCTAASSGALTCVVKMAAPAGNDSFIVATYSQQNQLGSQIDGTAVTTKITAGRTTVCLKQQPTASNAPAR